MILIMKYNSNMHEFMPYFTNDGSVGLYNSEFEDIYHSASGAMTEAYEKFVYPINFDILLQNEEIRVLDICYGIGYNTKCFLNYLFQNKKNFLKKKKFLKRNSTGNIETIYTNNNLIQERHNDTIHTDNIFNKISVTAVDNDKILTAISPFIKTGEKHLKNNEQIIQKHDIYKYLKQKRLDSGKISNEINFLILSELLSKSPELFNNKTFDSIIHADNYKKYFTPEILGGFRYLYSKAYTNYHTGNKLSNLHNIYYKYLSNCYKMNLNRSYLGDVSFNMYNADAREFIKNDKYMYNLIFLDAFTPTKCPCLWSLEFFKELYNHLETNGMIFTYSSSAAVRNAMKNSGFHIGNIFNKRLNRFQGSIASKNPALINYPLSEADLGLLNTRAGIFYRDQNLNASNEAIISRHKTEVANSDLISSSKYLKDWRKNEI